MLQTIPLFVNHETLTDRATALENAVAYVRWTMYDVRFGEFARLRRGDAELMRSKHCELSMGTHEGWVE